MEYTALTYESNALTFLEILFSKCQDAIVVADKSGGIIYANDKALEICHGEPELLINPSGQAMWSLPHGGQQTLTEAIELPLGRIIAGAATTDIIFSLKFPLLAEERWLSVSGYTISNSSPWAGISLLIARDISKQKFQDGRTSHLSHQDELTGLLTRNLFLKEVENVFLEARNKSSSCFTLLLIDIDRFKAINESFGHTIGDLLLIKMSDRIKETLRRGDIAARWGGDEFAVLLKHITARPEIVEIVDQLVDSISNSYCFEGDEIFADVSIGISIYDSSYQTSEELIRDADIAMYRSKLEPEVYYKFFEPKMQVVNHENLKLEIDLRHALVKQEFLLHYQPIVSIKSQEISGFEALVRWNHPERGLLSPAKFIPVAESTGMIVPLGWWVLREVCQQMQIWNENLSGSRSQFVSVNMSSKQFSQKYVVEKIQGILEETKLPGQNLKLELTESILIAHSDSIISQMEEIRAMGIKLAIDDFGTGYSSLSYLHRFPFDTLKIDRSFIEDADSDFEKLEILQSVVRLAWNLGLEVVAEGIETPKNHAQLRALNCEFGQGYLFSRPVDARGIERLLSQ